MRQPASWLTLALVALLPLSLGAQQPSYPPAAGKDSSETPRIEFSGLLFANFQYRTVASARDQNRFDVERAYLTARAAIAERVSARVTIDVFQQQNPNNDGFYRGWVIRAKYAYLQYDAMKAESPAEWSALARFGMLHTVMIEHLETFWPRWLGNASEERFGYFASADLGAAGSISLPDKLGEVYATVTNGPGYTSRETDRFKDFAARLTLTPLANSGSPILRTATLTAWGYRGALASRFVSGGAGQVGSVGSGLKRDRWGAFAGLRDPRLTAVVGYSRRIDESELGDNTPISPRVVVETTGRLFSTFAVVRPLALAESGSKTPLRLVARYDRFRPDDSANGRTRFIVAGVIWDLARTTSLAVDYQEQTTTNAALAPTTKTWFLHLVAGF
jgi:hypothetical protein